VALISQLLSILLPVFVCAAIGFARTRAGRPFDTAMVGQIVVLIATPCLVFHTLTKAPATPAGLLSIAVATVVYWIVMGLLATLVLRLSHLPS
jgi:malate permease and related proteins